ncbi:dirigent protein 25 [Prunus yedoensis var. nudiflora]|uniref:Dirigent protein 25 n=1 Tax=Prunus yedoensis var. nudiflora TaxID=2094558 RepID=A0A314YC47_PRUYE|nr:dirigent protein 25 [Prunus yedoensis var. nudiflora]
MATQESIPLPLKLKIWLLLLALAIPSITPARILDEENPATPQEPDTTPTQTPLSNVAPAAATSATVSNSEAYHPLTFFLHDIIGGSNPSATAVTGIVTNPAVNGQVPFAKPNGALQLDPKQWEQQHHRRQRAPIPKWGSARSRHNPSKAHVWDTHSV